MIRFVSTIVLSAFALTFCARIEVVCVTMAGKKISGTSIEVYYRDPGEHAYGIASDMEKNAKEFFLSNPESRPEEFVLLHSVRKELREHIPAGSTVDVLKILDPENERRYSIHFIHIGEGSEPTELSPGAILQNYLCDKIRAWHADPERPDTLALSFTPVFLKHQTLLGGVFCVQDSGRDFVGLYYYRKHVLSYINIQSLNLDADQMRGLVGPFGCIAEDQYKGGKPKEDNVRIIIEYLTSRKKASPEKIAEFTRLNAE